MRPVRLPSLSGYRSTDIDACIAIAIAASPVPRSVVSECRLQPLAHPEVVSVLSVSCITTGAVWCDSARGRLGPCLWLADSGGFAIAPRRSAASAITAIIPPRHVQRECVNPSSVHRSTWAPRIRPVLSDQCLCVCTRCILSQFIETCRFGAQSARLARQLPGAPSSACPPVNASVLAKARDGPDRVGSRTPSATAKLFSSFLSFHLWA